MSKENRMVTLKNMRGGPLGFHLPSNKKLILEGAGYFNIKNGILRGEATLVSEKDFKSLLSLDDKLVRFGKRAYFNAFVDCGDVVLGQDAIQFKASLSEEKKGKKKPEAQLEAEAELLGK